MELLRPATGQTLWGLELNSGCLIWPLCICPYNTLINYMAQINNPYYIHCVTKGTTYICWSLSLLEYFTDPQKGGIKIFLTSSECFGLILSKNHSFHNHDHIWSIKFHCKRSNCTLHAWTLTPRQADQISWKSQNPKLTKSYRRLRQTLQHLHASNSQIHFFFASLKYVPRVRNLQIQNLSVEICVKLVGIQLLR